LTSAEALADSAPVRKLLNMVLLLAIKDHASDVHFEPFEEEFRIRIKADGVLYEMVPPPRHLAFAITTRIKVMANLDIAERRLPQDGRIELSVGGHPVDLRISVLPTMFGESVVMRVLDRSVVSLDLTKVGMNDETLQAFREVIAKPNGIVLVTGPTGSGKTTTLYSALSELNRVEDKIITTEDPVEYDIEGIIQIPIDADIGNTFAFCLRSILRQDPDRILVGEIRDFETAEIAVQASLTGHIVFSTLHTNDSVSAITRLLNMDLPPYLISSSLAAIVAQRLARKICDSCREIDESVTAEQYLAMGFSAEEASRSKLYRGQGCPKCDGTGATGRRGIFEVLRITDSIKEGILKQLTTLELLAIAKEDGFSTMQNMGRALMLQGEISAEEYRRVLLAG
jgi:type IV pilus assembly protein PilB